MSSIVAYFVTPHGFGHAARAAAVMEAVARRDPEVVFEIVTTVPEWFFAQSLSVSFRMRRVACDVGLVQLNPVREDLPATVEALERFWSAFDSTAADLARIWRADPPEMVISDISPLGLAVGSRLGVPSVLVENFTWDWIYAAYFDQAPALRSFASRSDEMVALASLHLQCEPMCRRLESAVAVSPVSRTASSEKAAVRRALGLAADDSRPLVLLTMGGLGWDAELPRLDARYVFVTLGGVDRLLRKGNLVRLPDRSPIYPPDLFAAADAVVGKLGYSTVAECYQSGARLGFIGRPVFPESAILETFVRENLVSVQLELDDDSSGIPAEAWAAALQDLLARPRGERRTENGADEIAVLADDILA